MSPDVRSAAAGARMGTKRSHELTPLIDWGADVPPEIRAALEPLLDHYDQIWPMWMQELHIQYHPERQYEMSIDISYKYRIATLMPTGFWMHLDQRDREQALLHEVAHTFWNPADEVLESLLPFVLDLESPHGKFAKGRYEKNVETACQDLALMLYRNLGPAKRNDSQA